MATYASNYEEMLINEFQKELHYYSKAFFERITVSFQNLEQEAEKIQEATYQKLAETFYDEGGDVSGIAESAYHEGVDFYLTTDSIRQGLYNLMIAGLFHLFEQQAARFCSPHSRFTIAKPGLYPVMDMKNRLAQDGLEIGLFNSWLLVEELNLVANVTKHGDGRSSEILRKLNPKLFITKFDKFDPQPSAPRKRLRPLVGEGLELSECHFTTYREALSKFWEDLRLKVVDP